MPKPKYAFLISSGAAAAAEAYLLDVSDERYVILEQKLLSDSGYRLLHQQDIRLVFTDPSYTILQVFSLLHDTEISQSLLITTD